MKIYCWFLLYLFNCCCEVYSKSLIDTNSSTNENTPSRRILKGAEVGETRPYMVYLRPAKNAAPEFQNSNWLCGGVIIHPQYILTSAACIEDVKHFYVVSGTHTWVPLDEDDECVKYGAKKAIWKCVPKDYIFDGKSFDNIQWMNNDIAVVKVEDEFNFDKRVRGCHFIPQMVQYNNQSKRLEKAKTVGSISGWGTTDRYMEADEKNEFRAGSNYTELLETDVEIISKKACKKRWDERYHNIIDAFMICSRDPLSTMSALCTENVKCEEIDYDKDEDDEDEMEEVDKTYRARKYLVPKLDNLTAIQVGGVSRKANKMSSGGFCQHDHGGPLVVGYGTTAVVVGIQSACQTQDPTQKCFGPFLYTSVFRNRIMISCAINKYYTPTCRRIFADSRTQTDMDWKNHPDGPAKVPSKSSIVLRATNTDKTNKSSNGHKPKETTRNALHWISSPETKEDNSDELIVKSE